MDAEAMAEHREEDRQAPAVGRAVLWAGEHVEAFLEARLQELKRAHALLTEEMRQLAREPAEGTGAPRSVDEVDEPLHKETKTTK
jgi:ABC-type Zn2+ transport system substrate-binding protein/surface adhesin